MQDITIGIVGAGIAGLSAAIALARSGQKVIVLEQADTLGEIGAGLSIWDNGLQALGVLGLRDALEAQSCLFPNFEIHRGMHQYSKLKTAVLSEDGKTPARIAKRGDLFSVLYEGLPPLVEVVTRFVLESVEERSDNVCIRSLDGRQFNVDLLIGADGVNSVVRQLGAGGTPRFCNQMCFRGMAHYEEHPYMGRGAEIYDADNYRFGFFPCSETEIYWFILVNSDQMTLNFTDHHQHIAELSPIAADILTHSDAPVCHPVFEMPPVGTPRKRVVLIGDAAHPIQPSLGQGANLALEDGVVFAQVLQDAVSIEEALQTFVKRRYRRWKTFYSISRNLGLNLQERGGFMRRLQLFIIRYTPHWANRILGRWVLAWRP